MSSPNGHDAGEPHQVHAPPRGWQRLIWLGPDASRPVVIMTALAALFFAGFAVMYLFTILPG